MCVTHHLMVIHPCAKYGKPFQTKQKLKARHESAQTDGQTMFPCTPRMGGGGGDNNEGQHSLQCKHCLNTSLKKFPPKPLDQFHTNLAIGGDGKGGYGL